MSASHRYRLEQQLRRQEHLRRVRETTAAFYERYMALYQEMSGKGYDAYIPAELERAREQLEAIRRNLEHNPEHARDLSMDLGGYISRLPTMARATQREFEQREHQRMLALQAEQLRAQSQFAAFVAHQLQRFHDPVVRDFAFPELQALQQEVTRMHVDAGQVDALAGALQERLAAIEQRAAEQATRWKQQKQQELQGEAVQQLVEIHRAEAAKEQSADPAVQAALAMLAQLSQQVSRGNTLELEEVQGRLNAAVAQVDEAVVDERCRREAVKAVMATLTAAGFTLAGSPRRQKEGDRDEVLIVGRRPGGNQAEFRVGLTGDFVYTFDGYEGAACKQDIDKMLPMLQEVYGFKLSERRVLWENPDRIGRTAKPLAPGEEAKGHGR